MTRNRLTSLHRDDSGTAITEAALVMIPLVLLLVLSPAIYKIWMNEQHARTEAHRDMFDKTTTFLIIPEADRTTSGHFDQISISQRRHAYPAFPASIDGLAGNPNGFIAAPDGQNVTVGPQVVDIFPDGFPNQFVEGWKYRKVAYSGGWFTGEVELMRYGAVARSPWTWLGWPYVPTQDAWWEPQKIQGWYGDNDVNAVWVLPFFSLKKSLKLIDD